MRLTSLLILLLTLAYFRPLEGQVSLFEEDFEGTTLGLTSSSVKNNNNWSLTDVFSVSGQFADSASVGLADTTYLTTDAFSTLGSAVVYLEFDQICKLELFDVGLIEVSSDNGQTWTSVTSGYMGGGVYQTPFQTGFNANSYSLWDANSPTLTPNSSWWKHEKFNLSAYISNAAQAKIRFALMDKLSNGGQGSYGWLIDNVSIWKPVPFEASLVSSQLPLALPSGCGLSNETIKVRVRNNGSSVINGNLTVNFQREGLAAISELIPSTIQPFDTLTYTLTNQIDLSTTVDTNYNYNVWISLTGDTLSSNDSLSFNVDSKVPLVDPVFSNPTIPYGTSTTLTVTHTDSITWATDPLGANVFHYGSIYTTPILTDTTTYYVQAGANQGGVFMITEVCHYKSTTGAPTAGWPSYLIADDYIEITGVPGSDLGGYTLEQWTSTTQTSTHTFSPGTVLGPNGTCVIAVGQMGASAQSPADYYYHGQGSYTGTFGSTTAAGRILKSPSGNIVDAVVYGNYTFPAAAGVTAQDWSGTTLSVSSAGNRLEGTYTKDATNWINSGTSPQNPNILNTGVTLPATAGCPSKVLPLTVSVSNVPQYNAGVLSVNSPVGGIGYGVTSPVNITLKNFAPQNLTSVTINYSVNGVVKTPYSWTGNLAMNDTVQVTIGSETLLSGIHEIVAWTSNPNGNADGYTVNDSAEAEALVCLSGTFTVGGSSADFQNLTDAAYLMNTVGICGPVALNINDGTYYGAVELNTIAGVSAINTITIQSTSGDSTLVILTDSFSKPLSIIATSYVSVRNIMVNNQLTSASSAISISGGSNNCVVENCVLISAPSTTTTSRVLSVNSSTNENLIIRNNIVKGGYTGIYLYGSGTTTWSKNNQILNNDVSEYYYYGIYTYYQDSVRILNNYIHDNAYTTSYNYGMYIGYIYNGYEVMNNKISVSGGSYGYGIREQYGNSYSYYDTATMIPGVIANNFITVLSGNTCYGFYTYYSSATLYAYNSINILSGSTNSYGIYQSNSTSTDFGQYFYNNNIVNNFGGYAIYINTPAKVVNMDYNNYFTTGPKLAKWSSDRIDLAALQAANGMDQHSVSVNPNYFSSTDLHMNSSALNGSALPLANITTDIDGELRDATMPDMGADEIDLIARDAGIASMLAPYGACVGVAEDVIVELKNFGVDTLTSCYIDWSINTSAQTQYTFTGTIAPGQTSNVTVGTVTMQNGVSYDFEFITSNPNGSTDQNKSNDTLLVQGVNHSLSGGTYTIGSNAGDDFASFTEAVQALNNGICGAIIFDVKAGTYNENIEIGSIPGSSSTNTVTFKSLTGDSTSVILTSNLTAVKLFGASFVSFENMTISTTGTSSVSAVEIIGGASDINLENCILTNAPSSTSTSRVVNNNTGIENNIAIVNNKIHGGYYGIYLNGSSSSLRESGNIIANNEISGFYYYGVRSAFQDSVVIFGNKIHNNAATTGYIYGIYNYYCYDGFIISNNEININPGSYGYGIYDYYSNYYSQYVAGMDPVFITNNIVVVNSGTYSYGIRTYYSNDIFIANNSVNINSGTTNGYALYQYNTTSNTLGQNFYNNSFVNSFGGYAAYFSVTTGVANSDYNNYFTTGNNLAYWSSAKATLQDLQSASGKEQHSISLNPAYISSQNLHTYSQGLNGVAIPLTYVTHDFDGELRSTTTPDIGADEFTPPTNDLAILEILTPTGAYCGLDSMNIEVKLMNNGTADIQNGFVLKYSIDGGQTYVSENVNATINSTDTVVHIFTAVAHFSSVLDTIYNVWVVGALSGDPLAYNDTVKSTFERNIIPVSPVFAAASTNYATAATLSATSNYTVRWYDDATSVTPLATGLSYTTPVLFLEKMFYADAITSKGCISAMDSVLVTLNNVPQGDLGISGIFTNQGCGLTSNELVTIDIFNIGNGTITNGATARYRIGNQPWSAAENITAAIGSYDTIQYTFAATADLFTSVDTTFSIEAEVILASDPYALNNNLLANNIVSLYKPNDPQVVSPISVAYGASATLSATSIDSVVWFQNFADTVPVGGGIYHTPYLYDTTEYYAQALVLGSSSYNNIPLSSSGGNVCNPTGGGNMFDVYVYNNSIRIDSIVARFNAVGQKPIKVYYRVGGFSGFETDPTAWIFHDSTEVTTSSTGVLQGFSIKPLTLMAGETYGIYLMYDANYASGANLYQNADLAIQTGLGLCGSFSGINFPRSFSGTLFYNVLQFGCASNKVPLVIHTGTPPPVDAGMATIESPASQISAGVSIPIQVRIKNFGTDTLQSANISFEYQGLVISTTPWTGSLAPGDTSQMVTLTNYTFSGGIHDLRFYVSNANGTSQGINPNDTMDIQISACLNGVYTLGTPSSDYPTFTAALNDLQASGICSNVTFKVEPGTYNEQITFFPTIGADANSRITFESATGDSTDVVIAYQAGGATSNWTVRFDGADFYSLRNMTIQALDSVYGTAVEMINGAEYNIVENNIITSIPVSETTNRCIYDYNTLNHYNTYNNNKLIGGYYGIYVYGVSNSNWEKGTVIKNNDISGFYYYGINSYYQDSIRILNNKVHDNAPTTGYIYGINAYYCFNGLTISGNTVDIQPGTNGYGLRSYFTNHYNYVTPNAAQSLINNNMISISSGTTAYGLYAYYDDNSIYEYNTVHVSNASGTTYGLYQSNTASNTTGISFLNNIFANTAGDYAAYFSGYANVNQCDYNNFYSVGTDFVYWASSNRVDLPSLISISGKNTHSYSVDPYFTSATDLHVSNVTLNNVGTPSANVTLDIDGDIRNASTPDIGADEFDPIPTDALVAEIVYPYSPAMAGNQPVKVILSNQGSDTISSVQVNWAINGAAQAPYSWTGTLATNQLSDTVEIGTYNFVGGIYEIQSWTSSPNGSADLNPANDTATTKIIVCVNPLKGVYTIGGVSADFQNFSDAALSLNYCGVDSVVVFNVNSGVYNEKIVINEVYGASSSNTITFQSTSGDSTDVVLTYGKPASLEPLQATLALNGADYVTFRGMTINSTTSGASYNVYLTNGANHNTITNCVVTAPALSSSTTRNIVLHGGLNNYNQLNYNVIKGGYYAVYNYGESTTNLAQSNSMTGNQISEFYTYGATNYYQDSMIFQNNYITENSVGNGNYPATFGYCDNYLEVSGNQLDLYPKSTTYGLRIYYCDATIGMPGRVFNNNISINDGTGTNYGLYVYYSNYQNVSFNNVNLTAGGSSSRALYMYNGGDNKLVNNNLVTKTQAYTIYYSGSGLTYCDYNNLYTTSVQFAYLGSNLADLAAWKTASGFDSHSKSLNPHYYAENDLHVANPGLKSAGIAFDNVTVDFDGDARPTTPDIGSDQFVAQAKDAVAYAVLKPAGKYLISGSVSDVKLSIMNFGTDTLYNIPVGYIFNNATAVSELWTGTLLPGDTIVHTFSTPIIGQTGAKDLCVFTGLANDMNTTNDTFCTVVTSMPMLQLSYTDKFDQPTTTWAQDGDVWERGVPNQTVLNAAYSAPNAWMTMLNDNYPNSAEAFLYSPYFDVSSVIDATLKFRQKHVLGSDMAYVQYTIDEGQTWILLGYENDPKGTNWYNATTGGTSYFAGTKDTFVLSTYDMSNILSTSGQTVQFRFVLKTDASGTNEGWLVDDFSFELPPVQVDAGIVEILSPTINSTQGSNVDVTVRIVNFGLDTLKTIPVSYSINGGSSVNEVWNLTAPYLATGDTGTYSFSSGFLCPNADYNLCVNVNLANDGAPNNNQLCETIHVVAGPTDAGVIAIISPSDTAGFGVMNYVTVRIKNFGSNPLSNVDVQYVVNGLNPVVETWTGTALAQNDSVDFTFVNGFMTPFGGSFQLCSKTNLVGDLNANNDQTCKSIVTSNLVNVYADGLKLWQNQPNPATGNTLIKYEIPSGGQVNFNLRNTLGQLILQKSESNTAGIHSIELDASQLSNGVYLYTIEFNGYRMTRQMVVNK